MLSTQIKVNTPTCTGATTEQAGGSVVAERRAFHTAALQLCHTISSSLPHYRLTSSHNHRTFYRHLLLFVYYETPRVKIYGSKCEEWC